MDRFFFLNRKCLSIIIQPVFIISLKFGAATFVLVFFFSLTLIFNEILLKWFSLFMLLPLLGVGVCVGIMLDIYEALCCKSHTCWFHKKYVFSFAKKPQLELKKIIRATTRKDITYLFCCFVVFSNFKSKFWEYYRPDEILWEKNKFRETENSETLWIKPKL